jgi:two-component system, chemotaxis family, chemotaxis protein CheY
MSQHLHFIMVVDDDAMVRDIINEYLQTFGYRNIILLKDGASAIRHLQNPHHKIDLIISDWEMPELDGLGLLQAVRRSPFRKDTKFLMVTSQRTQERSKITRAAHWKVDAYIVKPFRGTILKEKVEQLLGITSDSDSDAA